MVCSVRLAYFALVLAFASASLAAIPNIMNLQGRLTDASSVSVNGTHNFTLRIYDAYTSGNLQMFL